jgi:hypothetical protein
MKKVKLMLLSLSVLAVAGGALAFKVKQDLSYCTAPTVIGIPCKELACPTRAFLNVGTATEQQTRAEIFYAPSLLVNTQTIRMLKFIILLSKLLLASRQEEQFYVDNH